MRFLKILFVLCFSIHITAWAVEPTRVNFAAKREKEDAIVKDLEAFFEQRKPNTYYPDEREQFRKVMAPFYEGVSPSAYSRLVDVYFKVEAGHDTKFLRDMDSVLTYSAQSGRLSAPVLHSILRKSSDGRLTEIVTSAIRADPALDTPALREVIHEEFSRIVKKADYPHELHGSILELADSQKIKATPKVLSKLTELMQRGSFLDEIILEANPRLLPLLISDRRVPDFKEAEQILSAKRTRALPPGYAGGIIESLLKYDLPKAELRELRQAMLDASRDRVRMLLVQPFDIAKQSADGRELRNALDLLKELDRIPYLTELQKFATAPGYDDSLREHAMLVLERSAKGNPAVRKTIFEAAGLLTSVRPETVALLDSVGQLGPLSPAENESLRALLSRSNLPADAKSEMHLKRLSQVRRAVLTVLPSNCASAFGDLKP